MAKLGPRTEIGIEDVIWIRCLKSLGVLPTVPFFNIIHEFDLSDEDDNVSATATTATTTTTTTTTTTVYVWTTLLCMRSC